ncbi:adenosylcobinamide-GDP ribazoletransferase [Sphingomonas naphthae]|uniref:Adenosylcobinamide-GDP ribazoletransferase n=1 Tax=Sphingomonas naphthae TaxID=1813468 RepID=A0ABY7TH25_9SPHN|nr:adenosylcobinamide-GDP ribazoletransferase [Sphingomonas naphthae]WCT72358.1 adenosylcobinamide-GDP ribazoletransferase [Sphingomonas naphthae]
MKGLILAIQFLTRLPMPAVRADAGDFARSMRWFPAVGLIVGAVVAGAGWAGLRIDGWAGALAALVAWVAVTGALHLDGLSDLADAAGAAHKGRDRLLAVLADPHVGSFGAVAIGLQLLAKLVLLHAVIERGLWWPLALIPFAARIAPLVWTLWLSPLHEGLAARFRGAIGWPVVVAWAVVLAGAAWLSPGLLVTAPAILAFGGWLKARIGGISGDGHGAGIELVETALLLAILL